ncbi:hypothetical protein GCM10009716_45950 [Streptomyces sodiiphilus]|uniref:Uncharacterized protein n=1 Tax=Streptomyces sodiiphilus TaxID=226217 RepID=A0ABN2PV36_9ACTN
MRVEIRLATPERLEEVLALPVDAVSFGQEGCWTKLPSRAELRAAAEAVRGAGRQAGVVLPAAWQRTAEPIAELGAALAGDGPVSLTVNDPGTLAVLAGTPAGEAGLCIGLALSPGRPHAVGPSPRSPSEPAVYEDGFLEELETFPARVLEADAGALVPERPGWRVRRMLDVVPVAWSRSCPTARHHGLPLPGCRSACDTPLTVTAATRWQLGHGHRAPVAVADRRHQEVLTVLGNAVYVPAPPEAPVFPDVIIDARFHPPAALAERVTAARRWSTAAPQEM